MKRKKSSDLHRADAANKGKKQYQAPRLVRHGDLKALTAAAGVLVGDGGMRAPIC